MKITDAELRPYGFIRGHGAAWCAECTRTVQGLDPRKAFKCRVCAVEQFKLVERQCETCGDAMPVNPVPEHVSLAA